MNKGLFLINTGHGKGKTSAALGVVLRALGYRQKIAVIQFIKSQETGESLYLEELNNKDKLFYRKMGGGFLISKEDEEKAKPQVKEAFELVKKLALENYNLIVLDEINIALAKNLIDIKEVINFIKTRPENLNIIFTGRNAPEEIINLADTVTEMKEIKHAYQVGIKAKKGIDY